MTQNAITLPTNEPHALTIAGQTANDFAAQSAFVDYRNRKANNTLRRQDNDLALFAQYLRAAGLQVGDFAQDPQAWRGISWGLVEGFARWGLQQGYAVTSVNVRLAIVKTYARLALKAGALDQTEFAMMTTVKGYSHKESKRVDEQRTASELPIRKGAKKSVAVGGVYKRIFVSYRIAPPALYLTNQPRGTAIPRGFQTDYAIKARIQEMY